MRFFDEDNKRFERALAKVLIVAVIYIGSFCIIRYRSTSDECNLQSVDLPVVVRTFYRPLVNIDKLSFDRVVYDGELDEVRVAMKHFCGE